MFRIERNGSLDRRPLATATALVERRGTLIAALLLMDCERRASATRASGELDLAFAELKAAVERARDHAQTRLEQIVNDLRVSRGEGLPSGIRSRVNGRALGRS